MFRSPVGVKVNLAKRVELTFFSFFYSEFLFVSDSWPSAKTVAPPAVPWDGGIPDVAAEVSSEVTVDRPLISAAFRSPSTL